MEIGPHQEGQLCQDCPQGRPATIWGGRRIWMQYPRWFCRACWDEEYPGDPAGAILVPDERPPTVGFRRSVGSENPTNPSGPTGSGAASSARIKKRKHSPAPSVQGDLRGNIAHVAASHMLSMVDPGSPRQQGDAQGTRVTVAEASRLVTNTMKRTAAEAEYWSRLLNRLVVTAQEVAHYQRNLSGLDAYKFGMPMRPPSGCFGMRTASGCERHADASGCVAAGQKRRHELKIKLEEHMQEVEAIKAQILEHMVHVEDMLSHTEDIEARLRTLKPVD